MMNYKKYRPYHAIKMDSRKWPSAQITKAPIWCSVDLRDGNQALEKPMNLEQKIDFFKYLVKIGFKQIEVGFPAASETEYTFTRTLIEQNLIPDDVTIQVLTQSREHIIRKTFEALKGAKSAIVHLYNSTSKLQRRVVFGKNEQEIIDLAVSGARLVYQLAEENGLENYYFEYSPESFTGTEVDYAVEISNAVIEELKPRSNHKVILNLPSTVEMSTPNVLADQIEYVCNNIKNRENVIVSIHAHNDRGTAVASTELALLAGADRVEGTLFGNGERTGNADIMNLALNMFSQGVDPELDFSDINSAIKIYEESTGIQIHPRHPYAGDLVYTAFSGSHQDAIKKGMAQLKDKEILWEVPYLPIDPLDVGRSYDPIIRINSQSGKGGVAYILEQNYGLVVPKIMQADFSKIITDISDKENKELSHQEIYDLFISNYVVEEPLKLIEYQEESYGSDDSKVIAKLLYNGKEVTYESDGHGVVDAFCKAVQKALNIDFDIVNYSEHSLDFGNKSRAITYIHIYNKDEKAFYGAGISKSITKSSIRALVSAINKIIQ